MEHSPEKNRRDFSLCLLATLALGLGAPARAQAPAQANAAAAPVVLVVGDSLSAEYGLRRGSGWVALTEARLQQEKRTARLVNASVSGDTTSGGRSRLPALLKQHQPAVVVIELGGNDALRGLPLSMTRENLATMVRAAKAAGARVLLLGMEMPPNYGAKYGQEFRELFASVAREEKSALVPFFLKGVADGADPLALFQSDRIHPNDKAQPQLLKNVWPALERLLG